MAIRVSIDLTLDPSTAFNVVVEELKLALARLGMRFEPGSKGRLVQGNFEVGRITSWEPGKRIVLEWRQASWEPGEVTEAALLFEPLEGGTRLKLEHYGWGRLIGEDGEMAGWFASELVAPLLRAMAPEALGDWITDRRARRPSGAQARAVYRDPLYHYPNFRVILSELALTADDYLLEVGCGGGAMLREALKSGCRAAGIDHSAEMVQLAREVNRDAVNSGRLEVLEASADQLPFPDGTFTCAAMTGVLGFLPDPTRALAELQRVMITGGRLVVLGMEPDMRGTPAAPEPIASRLNFYSDDELAKLARKAGFGSVQVVRRELEAFAREAGVPEAHLPLFAGPGASFLLARK